MFGLLVVQTAKFGDVPAGEGGNGRMSYAVLTTVQVRPGSIDDLALLFDETNRDLVSGQDDWLGASFTANRSKNEITVVARWRSADSYERLRDSPEFQSVMAKFADSFVSPPSISINEVLVEMLPS